MKCIIFRTGGLCNFHQLLICHIAGTKFCQGNRQSDFDAPQNDIFQFFFRNVFQYQLSKCSKCNFFSMIHMVAFFQYCKSIVDRMCSRKSGTFKSDTGKERVRFDHFFDCRCTYTCFQCNFGFYAFFHQRIKAKFCKCHRCFRCLSACTGSCTAAFACSRLEVSCKCISHTGYCKAYR